MKPAGCFGYAAIEYHKKKFYIRLHHQKAQINGDELASHNMGDAHGPDKSLKHNLYQKN